MRNCDSPTCQTGGAQQLSSKGPATQPLRRRDWSRNWAAHNWRALHKALHCNRSDTRLRAIGRYDSVRGIDRHFHPFLGANDGFAFLKFAADLPFVESQCQFGPRDHFYASQLAKIYNRAVSSRALNHDLAISEYCRAGNGVFSVNRHRVISYQLTF
jgi:hypothetical protein